MAAYYSSHGKNAAELQSQYFKKREHMNMKTENTKIELDAVKVLLLGKVCPLGTLIETDGLGVEDMKLNLKKFYIKQCKKVIDERVKYYKKQLRVNPKSIEIMDSRTKWGSCDSNRHLKFNYALAMVPLELIDYVVVHELCHIVHMNHDRSFWRLVGSIVPDYKKNIELLNRYTQHTMDE